MWQRLLHWGWFSWACCVPAAGMAAVGFVASPPLTQVVRVPVGDVAAGPVQVPLITWGGDIATILANGNGLTTTPDSPLGRAGLRLQLKRQDVFTQQLEDYLAGRSPYLRGTLGMVTLAAEVAARDPRTRPVVVHQLTWSAGGDALVVKPGIRSAQDLKGRTIALQAYGPHVDYMAKILADAGLAPTDVQLRWVSDLTGGASTPAAALREPGIDAAFVISTDAMALTSGGGEGTGAGASVAGARILMSTRTANRVIADVYAVRADYLRDHRADVERFVAVLTQAQDDLQALVAGKAEHPGDYKSTFGAAALLLLGDPQALDDVESLYADAQLARLAGNLEFFARTGHPRGLAALSREIQSAFVPLGLLSRTLVLQGPDWSLARLAERKAPARPRAGTAAAAAPSAAPAAVHRAGHPGTGELFSFEVLFEPNEDRFSPQEHTESFRRVIGLVSSHTGALLSVVGHSDPSAYLRAKKAGAPQAELDHARAAAHHLSVARATALREAVIAYARQQGLALDPARFALVGHGLARPRTGTCGADPCAPRTEQEWRANMRAELRVVWVEAEAGAFSPVE